MKILLIVPLPPPVTGHSLASEVLLDALSGSHDVEVVNLSVGSAGDGRITVQRLREVGRLLWAIWHKKRWADTIYFTISESHAGNLKDVLIYLVCFSRLRRLVIHLHGGAGMTDIMRGRLRRLNGFFLKRVGAVIVLGKTQLEIYRGVVPESRIHVVPNFAVDQLFLTPGRVDDKFQCTNPLRFLFLSNMLPGKGHEEMVAAFLALDEETKRWVTLDLAGHFESERPQEAFLAKIAGVDHIRYHGPVAGERKRTLFARAHVFCLPTYYPYEGQPISILEAYASGCAVITSDHSGIPDVFQHDVNGFQVEKRSVTALRLAVQRAVSDTERLRRMAQANLQAALAKYRASRYTSDVMQILHSVGGTR